GLAPLALLLLAQLGSLQLGELLLALRLFLAQLDLLRVHRRRRRRRRGGRLGRDGRGGDLGRVALDEDALLAHLHLHRAVLAGGVGLADLARLLARQRDLVLALHRAVGAPQVLEQARLVLLAELVGGHLLLDPGRAQLLEQDRRRNLQLARELGNARLRHRYADSLFSSCANQCARAAMMSFFAFSSSRPVSSESSSTARSARSSRVLMPPSESFAASCVSMPSSLRSSGSTPSTFSSLAIAATSSALRARLRSSFTVPSSKASISLSSLIGT